MFQKVLSVETSCDDTSVAVVSDQGFVLAQCSASQDLQHAPYGGVVPEIASRNHTLALLPLIEETLKKAGLNIQDIDGFAVTNRPGLIGSLIVGLMTVNALSQAYNKPFIGVNHLEGHLLAPFLKDQEHSPPDGFSYPYVALAVSGGHSSLYWVESAGQYTIVGATKDDAAGEAFDKFAKMIGLGYPGGVLVDRASKDGDRSKYDFPRSLIHEKNLMMSFSGLKSSAHRLLSKMSQEEIANERSHLCASFQEAVVETLIAKVTLAAKLFKTNKIVITGGVSANSRLREKVDELKQKGFNVVVPPLRYCTDNAAMIGYAGILQLNKGLKSQVELGPSSSSYEQDFKIKLRETL
ncbi:MAG: tRNA (adenosine(37)-N6)-threonylcarbamoyltransferase complex transferase subunit TsaD [Pseudobdellovibrio sp.]